MHVQHRHEIPSTPEHRLSFLRFYDHGLVRIVRDLTVKKYLDAGFMFPIYLLLF